jgi:hypothetical protein
LSLSLQGTATTVALTDVGPHGLAIRTEADGRFGTPIGTVVKGIEELSFARIREFTGVHAFVTDLIAVDAEYEFCRVEIIHSKITFRYAVLIPAA